MDAMVIGQKMRTQELKVFLKKKMTYFGSMMIRPGLLQQDVFEEEQLRDEKEKAKENEKEEDAVQTVENYFVNAVTHDMLAILSLRDMKMRIGPILHKTMRNMTPSNVRKEEKDRRRDKEILRPKLKQKVTTERKERKEVSPREK